MRGDRIIHLPPSHEEQRALDLAREALQVDDGEVRAVRERLDRIDPIAIQRSARTRRQRVIQVAAVAAAVAVAMIVGLQLTGRGDPLVQMVVETDPTQSQTVSPAAGVDVSVSADSRVAVVVDRHKEAVLELRQGQVAVDFEPTADVSTMRVDAGTVSVHVIGTRFTVARAGDQVAVSVDEGTVEVRWPDGRLAVAQGEAWTSGASPAEVTVAAAARPVADEQLMVAEALAVEGAADPPPIDNVAQRPTEPTEPIEPTEAGPQISDEAVLLARIGINRAAGVPAADRLADLDRFLAAYPGSLHGEEVLALRVEALAELGSAEEALAAAGQFAERYPDGVRHREVRWLEATVARDQLHDCARALPAYRELAEDSWGLWADAAYFRGICAAEQGLEDEARGALESALAGNLSDAQTAEARRVLGQL